MRTRSYITVFCEQRRVERSTCEMFRKRLGPWSRFNSFSRCTRRAVSLILQMYGDIVFYKIRILRTWNWHNVIKKRMLTKRKLDSFTWLRKFHSEMSKNGCLVEKMPFYHKNLKLVRKVFNYIWRSISSFNRHLWDHWSPLFIHKAVQLIMRAFSLISVLLF